jgi:hypothetical protein
MKHRVYLGGARVLPDDVPKWEAEGWTRVEKPRTPRKKDRAEPLAKPDDSADGA